MAALAVAALVAACGGDDAAPTVVATQDTKANVNPANVAAVSKTPFPFPNGIPALNTTGSTTLTVTAGTATTTPTFSVSSASGYANGTLGFGSCIFTINTSTVPGLPTGTVVTVQNCTINVGTAGDPGNGVQTPQPVSMTLDGATSSTVTFQVIISATGTVTIFNQDGTAVPTGSVETSTVTGGS